jgi:hypothetical protein
MLYAELHIRMFCDTFLVLKFFSLSKLLRLVS